jgi:hypothetical protein
MSDAQWDDGAQLRDGSRERARAVWQTVLLGRDKTVPRGLNRLTKPRTLVARIVELMRIVRRP